MPDHHQNNRQIAKNTVALYARTFITLLVGLYTSRIMLQALGVDDYGIYNVVGSIVAMSSLLTGAFTTSISRFITYSLGNKEEHRMKVVFSTSINVMIALSVVVVAALEVLGVWFLNFKADIPSGRMHAANWVLQFSIFTLLLNLLSSPYNATIIAHERMTVYAYISIVEVLLKLGVCFGIMAFHDDRLILFALLNAMVAVGLRLYYSWYCQHNFEESKYSRKLHDKQFLKEMFQFTGWYLIGNLVWVFNTQGINMLINVFFGVVMNAARGIAVTVTGAVTTFVNNFTIAFVPQITKSYASGDLNRMMLLIFEGTKITWFLLLILIIPVFWEANMLLKLWLGTPPEYSTVFLRFALFESWSGVISFALHNAILATGKIKRVQVQLASFTALIFPITWICFKLGVSAWYSCLIFFLINTLSKGFTLYNLKRQINFPVSKFMNQCVGRCTLVSLITFLVPGLVMHYIPASLGRFFITISVSLISTLIFAYYLGLNRIERVYANQLVSKAAHKILRIS